MEETTVLPFFIKVDGINGQGGDLFWVDILKCFI